MTIDVLDAAAAAAYPNVLPGDVINSAALLKMTMSTCDFEV
jgi:hypothetical protein